MKLYDLVKKLLEQDVTYRNSDKALMWKVWRFEGTVSEFDDWLSYENFLKASTPESITRCRRKVQERHPELVASKSVEEIRKSLEEEYHHNNRAEQTELW